AGTRRRDYLSSLHGPPPLAFRARLRPACQYSLTHRRAGLNGFPELRRSPPRHRGFPWASSSPPPCGLGCVVHAVDPPASIASVSFEDRREAHARANAHRDHAMLDLRVALHCADKSRDTNRSRGAERVTERDRAALWIDLRGIEFEGAHTCQGLGGKGFVQLN